LHEFPSESGFWGGICSLHRQSNEAFESYMIHTAVLSLTTQILGMHISTIT